jgi:hypothetical protein
LRKKLYVIEIKIVIEDCLGQGPKKTAKKNAERSRNVIENKRRKNRQNPSGQYVVENNRPIGGMPLY